MEMKRILELATLKAIELWEVEDKHYNNFPNELTKARADKAWNNVKELEQMLLKEESK